MGWACVTGQKLRTVLRVEVSRCCELVESGIGGGAVACPMELFPFRLGGGKVAANTPARAIILLLRWMGE